MGWFRFLFPAQIPPSGVWNELIIDKSAKAFGRSMHCEKGMLWDIFFFFFRFFFLSIDAILACGPYPFPAPPRCESLSVSLPFPCFPSTSHSPTPNHTHHHASFINPPPNLRLRLLDLRASSGSPLLRRIPYILRIDPIPQPTQPCARIRGIIRILRAPLLAAGGFGGVGILLIAGWVVETLAGCGCLSIFISGGAIWGRNRDRDRVWR